MYNTVRHCHCCLSEFEPKSSLARYCSDPCRKIAAHKSSANSYRKRRKEDPKRFTEKQRRANERRKKQPILRVCPICHVEFDGRGRKKTCSQQCLDQLREIKQRQHNDRKNLARRARRAKDPEYRKKENRKNHERKKTRLNTDHDYASRYRAQRNESNRRPEVKRKRNLRKKIQYQRNRAAFLALSEMGLLNVSTPMHDL